MPISVKFSLSQKGWCNKPTKLQFHSISHPITGFKDDSAYVTTKTADRNQRITEDW